MEKIIKQEALIEENKSLIALRNNYFTAIVLLTGGTVGLFFTQMSFIQFALFSIAGVYFIILFILKFQNASARINKNIGRLK